ncbi:hypothetical protein GJ744_002158 [Endocarpon pusillum]|uniref:Uncharacterized protein n=1 Tax=Endocarpon pusillum TaxID=364733 RepID=A0A8H7E1C3_9EURO|nr:hypothetical protein GJ744_002158 [Endocarpon pusillum]
MRGIFANRWVYRENRVPYYQRLMQKDDGKRLWWKSHRSAYILYPYYIMLYGSLTATMYAMCRMVLGHKTCTTRSISAQLRLLLVPVPGVNLECLLDYIQAYELSRLSRRLWLHKFRLGSATACIKP